MMSPGPGAGGHILCFTWTLITQSAMENSVSSSGRFHACGGKKKDAQTTNPLDPGSVVPWLFTAQGWGGGGGVREGRAASACGMSHLQRLRGRGWILFSLLGLQARVLQGKKAGSELGH